MQQENKRGSGRKKKLNTPITILGRIVNGKITMKNKSWFLSQFKDIDDCNIKWIVERERRTRSRKLENYLWGIVYPLASQSLGYRTEELHEIFKSKFLKRKKMWRGADMTTICSTKDLSQEEYSEFVEKIIMELGELSITVPIPNKYYKESNEFDEMEVTVHKLSTFDK